MISLALHNVLVLGRSSISFVVAVLHVHARLSLARSNFTPSENLKPSILDLGPIRGEFTLRLPSKLTDKPPTGMTLILSSIFLSKGQSYPDSIEFP